MCDRHTEKKIDGLEFWVQNLQFHLENLLMQNLSHELMSCQAKQENSIYPPLPLLSLLKAEPNKIQ